MPIPKPIRVKLDTDRDAVAAIEAVQGDRVPREIERDGEVVAYVVPVRVGRHDLAADHSRETSNALKPQPDPGKSSLNSLTSQSESIAGAKSRDLVRPAV